MQQTENIWKPTLVILRIERAALDVKWSADGLRFAATSGAKCVSVCTYEPQNDWWVSKMIRKKFKSTVLCCAFHPRNGQLLATGSSDFKCRVFSTFASEVDTAPDPGVFGAPLEFGESYCELPCNGWVNAVAWTPSGETLIYAGHDSTIHFVKLDPGAAPAVLSRRSPELPYCSLLSLSDRSVIAVGHDFNPSTYVQSATGAWGFYGKIEAKSAAAGPVGGGGGPSEAAGGVAAARALFQNKASRGQESSEAGTLWTQHENTVTGICSLAPAGSGAVSKVSPGSVTIH